MGLGYGAKEAIVEVDFASDALLAPLIVLPLDQAVNFDALHCGFCGLKRLNPSAGILDPFE